MKYHIECTALDFAKTLITSDQQEMIEYAESNGLSTIDVTMDLAFDMAEAFHRERAARFDD